MQGESQENKKKMSVWAAVEKGDLDAVKASVENGADIEERGGWLNGTGLSHACYKGHFSIAEYLIHCGADVNSRNNCGDLPIHDACKYAPLDTVKLLINKGSNFISTSNNGDTPLHRASQNRDTLVADYLIQCGAAVDPRNNDGSLPIHYACLMGHRDTVGLLISKGSVFTATNKNGDTPLHLASSNGHTSLVEYLIQLGAKVNSSNNDGYLPIHYACSMGDQDTVELLITKESDFTATNKNGDTPLHLASSNRNTSLVEYLIQLGAKVNSRNKSGYLPIHHASKRGNLDTVKLLVRKGSDLTSADNGDTPLRLASINGYTLVAHYLRGLEAAGERPLDKSAPEGTDKDSRSTDMPHPEDSEYLEDKASDEKLKTRWKSVKHKSKLQKLLDPKTNTTKVGPVRVSFSREFLVGEGCMGTSVYVGLHDDGSEVAVKRMLADVYKRSVKSNEKEIANLADLKTSDHIVNYRSFIHETGDPFCYVILDLCEETLADYVKSHNKQFLERRGPIIIKEILTGLQALHNGVKKVLHKDLNPRNILVDHEGRMRLAGFGVSRILDKGATSLHTEPEGTFGWIAAESIKEREDGKVTFERKSDVQVAGMICFYILTKGEHLFGAVHERFLNIYNGNPVNMQKLSDPNARRFVSWLISRKIEDRPYVEQALADDYLQVPSDSIKVAQPVTAAETDVSNDAADEDANDLSNPTCTAMRGSSDDPSEIEETWFESNLMDEDSYDINKSTKDKLKRAPWISSYGLAWPNEERNYYHLLIYAKQSQTEMDFDPLDKLEELFGNEEIRNCVELRRLPDEVKVRFLADPSEPEVNRVVDDDQISAKPGVSVGIKNNQEDAVTPFTPLDSVKAILGDSPGFLRKGTLTAILQKNQDKNKKFAMIPFHVGYNGECEVHVSELQKSEDFVKQAQTLALEARNPSTKQRDTTYHYQPSNSGNYYLGKYLHGLFDKKQDALLISIPSDVRCKYTIENYSGHWGLKRHPRLRREAKVVKIGPRGTEMGVLHSLMNSNGDTPVYFNRYFVVGSTDSDQSFLQEGDSGSLVCLVRDGKFTPFAYGVCEADSHGKKGLCLDLKTVLASMSESGLAPCFGNCE